MNSKGQQNTRSGQEYREYESAKPGVIHRRSEAARNALTDINTCKGKCRMHKCCLHMARDASSLCDTYGQWQQVDDVNGSGHGKASEGNKSQVKCPYIGRL